MGGRVAWMFLFGSLGVGCYRGVDEQPFQVVDLADDDDDDDDDGSMPPSPPHDETTGGESEESSSGDDGFPLSDLGLPQPTTRLADGVELVRIELTQGVSADIGHGGDAVLLDSSLDPALVRGRDTLFRAHYVNAGLEGRTVEATLKLRTDAYDETIDTQTVALAQLGVVEWRVPGERLEPHLEYAVEFEVDVDAPVEYPIGAARTPADGYGELYVRSSPTALHVHVIPVRHQIGGCDSTPVPPEAWWSMVEDQLWMQYPISDLELVRGEPWTYAAAMTDFSAFLDALSAYRVAAGIGQHVYVYGLVQPCDGGEAGVGGRGWRSGSDAVDGYYRTSMGRWYADLPDAAAATVVHEIGHNHGRQHVACSGEGDPDPLYPIAGGSTGREGWGVIDGIFRPASHADFMTYCDPSWVSAYGWNLAFHRAAVVTENADADVGEARPVLIATEDGAGGLRWQTLSAHMPAEAPTASLDVVHDGITTRVAAVVTREGETGLRSFAAPAPSMAVETIRLAY